ncbi:Phosphorylated carbohydrates phosphatase [Hordeum vulgare]|nr:Phosphorylated carbohydrates phosphatase [Hordeum vulgare]
MLESEAPLTTRGIGGRDGEATQKYVCRRCGFPAEPDEDERLIAWVYHWSLTTTKLDARRLHRQNAKALWLAIEKSEHEAKEKATEAARLAKLKRQQDRAV